MNFDVKVFFGLLYLFRGMNMLVLWYERKGVKILYKILFYGCIFKGRGIFL